MNLEKQIKNAVRSGNDEKLIFGYTKAIRGFDITEDELSCYRAVVNESMEDIGDIIESKYFAVKDFVDYVNYTMQSKNIN